MQLLFMAAVGISWLFSPPPIPTVPFSADASFTSSGDRAWKGHNAANEELPTYEEIFAAADATEADIRATMLATDGNLSKYRKVDRVIIGAAYEGGTEVHGWYEGDLLRKALIVQGGETWMNNTNYYFAGTQPIASSTKAETYGGVLISRYADVQTRTNTERFYLDATVDKEIDPVSASDLRLITLALTDTRDEVFVREGKDGWERVSGPSPFERMLTALRRELSRRRN